ncbi:glutaredoxin domain-containing cysteine-rich protein 2 [Denticeps clupeoides]|uniref:Glutaredoxin domain-containing cysteine-rich protein 2 n=1 Tax=Denticeps clupeoides TaxID=299321 RepID=A0AAY4ATP5_9TELE|nr:glutaredoxin domain-containing cysteine-rich protein 2 [Denticeps clupeoides]
MEEPQRKFGSQRHEGKPRKVRFKLASSYSGRVLKHVYEDGQELDSPEEKYPHSFIHTKVPRHLEVGQLCNFEELQDSSLEPPTGLIAKRINVYRGVSGYRPPPYGEVTEEDPKLPVLDFGKIIIYTSNLRIIRSPHRKVELARGWEQDQGGAEELPKSHNVRRGKHRTQCSHGGDQSLSPTHKRPPDASSCLQCGGSGCAPCSLCHGSKLSMLANRFNESIRELRCQACYPEGLEPCQSCTQ